MAKKKKRQQHEIIEEINKLVKEYEYDYPHIQINNISLHRRDRNPMRNRTQFESVCLEVQLVKEKEIFNKD